MKTILLLSAVGLASLSALGSTVVQVRDVAKTPTIGVVAWDSDNAEVGLRTRIRRDGSSMGEDRVGEHRLFVSSAFVDARGGFALAVAQDGKLLRKAGAAQDADACRFDNVCTPRTTIGLGVSDEWLREHRDGVVVTMRPRTGQNWTISLDGQLIGSYLATVDSVAASLKKD